MAGRVRPSTRAWVIRLYGFAEPLQTGEGPFTAQNIKQREYNSTATLLYKMSASYGDGERAEIKRM